MTVRSRNSVGGRTRDTPGDLWHINSDEARFLDCSTEFHPAGSYPPDPYRSADNDPVLAGLGATRGNGPR